MLLLLLSPYFLLMLLSFFNCSCSCSCSCSRCCCYWYCCSGRCRSHIARLGASRLVVRALNIGMYQGGISSRVVLASSTLWGSKSTLLCRQPTIILWAQGRAAQRYLFLHMGVPGSFLQSQLFMPTSVIMANCFRYHDRCFSLTLTTTTATATTTTTITKTNSNNNNRNHNNNSKQRQIRLEITTWQIQLSMPCCNNSNKKTATTATTKAATALLTKQQQQQHC